MPSALTRLVALLGLVDDVYAALATHELVVAVTLAQALEAVANFHGLNPYSVLLRSPAHPVQKSRATPSPASNPKNSFTKWWARQGSNL